MIKTRTSVALIVTMLLLSSGNAAAQSGGTAFTYQGQLSQTGSPVTGTCDFQFALYDAASSGSQVGSTLSQTLGVDAGLFITLLDFGSSAWSGDPRYLEISVRCPAGSGAYTTLAPRQQLAPTPYAIRAGSVPWSGVTGIPADIADGDADTIYTAGTNVVISDTTISVPSFPWSSLTGFPTSCQAGDQALLSIGVSSACTSVVSSIAATDGITWTGSVDGEYRSGAIQLVADTAYLQRRVSSSCTAGSGVRAINSNGTVTCETYTLDEIGNPASDVTFNMANKNVHWVFTNPAGGMHWEFTGAASGHLLEIMTTGGNQTPGTHLLHIESDDKDALPLHLKTVSGADALLVEGGAVITGSTHYITGTTYINGIKNPDITAVTASTGLSGGGTSDNVTLSADTTYLQRRVSGTCTSGSSVTGVASDGTVTCGGLMTWTAYAVLPGNGISSAADAFLSTVWDSITVGTYTQTYYVSGTNNGSNYWTFRIKRGTDGTSLCTINTSSGSANTWGQSSGACSASVTTSNRWIAVGIEKTGLPGTLYLASPSVTYSKP